MKFYAGLFKEFTKRLVLLFVVMLFCVQNVQAKTITTFAKALDTISTVKPSTTFKVETLESVLLFDGTYMNGGSVISGEVIEIIKPKRGKKDSSFVIVPTSITCSGHETKIEHPNFTIQISEYKSVDKKQVAGAVARTALGIVFHGAAQGISFVQGVNDAPEGQKFKSGVHKVYSDSFISYVGKGQYILVKKGDTLMLKLVAIKNKD